MTAIRWAYFDKDGDELPQTAHVGFAALVIEGINGKTARIDWEQKLMANGYRAVFLGAEFEQDPAFDLWVEGVLRHGFSIDEGIIELTIRFIAALNADQFAPEVILTPENGPI